MLFGGFIRDVALFTAKGFNSDLDVVVDCDKNGLDAFFNFYQAHENRFGGYRLEVGGWSVDVWPLKETWAFKAGLVEFRDKSSLLDTTITNWDAIVYSFLDEKLIMRSNYLSQLYGGELDVVLVDNPNRMGAFLRVLRAIHDKQAKVLMPKLVMYLKSEFSIFSVGEIFEEQLRFFNKMYFTLEEVKSFKDNLEWMREDFFGTRISVRGCNFQLSFS